MGKPDGSSAGDEALRAVGSTFATEPSHSLVGGAMPWDTAGNVTHVQSGGQAIRLISELLWEDGRRLLQLPAFLCESMLEPFGSRPWQVVYYPTDGDLQPVLSQLNLSVRQCRETVAVAAGYFGRQLDSRSADALVDLQSRGVCVVEDRTHNLFDWSGPEPDFAFASLRKLLPVGDGAVVVGRPWAFDSDDSGPGVEYWGAMDVKAHGDQREIANARDLFAAAETRFQNELDPRGASTRTVRALQTMDYEGMAAKRRSNAIVLSQRLEGIVRVHRVLDDQVPSHLVVRVEDAAAMQRELSALGVFCPIHWPKPSRIPTSFDWPTGMLSLPVDHRYHASDMEYVATAVTRVVRHD